MCKHSANVAHCYIIPPHILRTIAERGNDAQKDSAFQAINISGHLRGRREAINNVALVGAIPSGTKRRTVYTAQNLTTLPGVLVLGEDSGTSTDDAVNEAFKGSGATYDFYKAVFNRNSIDDRGLRLDSTVHFDEKFNNAFWNGQQMVYGDGDGVIFNRFTISLDVIAHELTHGITQYEADLVYQDQPGALNEHFSDVFGALVRQKDQNQTAAQADWLIGKGLLGPAINGVALRSMKAPGTAYNDDLLGRDPQPDHMSKFNPTTADHGGVHINSGIPNKAFYNFAVSVGGYAWEVAGRVWYTTLCNELSSNASFQDCAAKTTKVAKDLFGAAMANKVKAAWKAVGINVLTPKLLKPATQSPQLDHADSTGAAKKWGGKKAAKKGGKKGGKKAAK